MNIQSLQIYHISKSHDAIITFFSQREFPQYHIAYIQNPILRGPFFSKGTLLISLLGIFRVSLRLWPFIIYLFPYFQFFSCVILILSFLHVHFSLSFLFFLFLLSSFFLLFALLFPTLFSAFLHFLASLLLSMALLLLPKAVF